MARSRQQKIQTATGSRVAGRRSIFTLLAGMVAACLWFSTPATVAAASSERDALDFLGRCDTAYAVGDFTAAIDHWTRTVEICRVAGLPDIGAEALARRGETHARMGLLTKATADLEAALERSRTDGERGRAAAYAGALGNVRLLSRDLDGAAGLLDHALAEAEALSDDVLTASAANNRGNVAMARQETEAAIDLYRRAAAAADRAGDERLRSVAWVNEARAALAADRPADVLAALDRVLSAAGSGTDGDGEATADRALSLVAAARVALDLPPDPSGDPAGGSARLRRPGASR
jgi:tetratricopeptide (TPR) repeat protein